MCEWWHVACQPYDLLVCFDERLQVVFVVVLVSPHSDVANEVWVCVGIVQSYHDPSVNQFVHSCIVVCSFLTMLLIVSWCLRFCLHCDPKQSG